MALLQDPTLLFGTSGNVLGLTTLANFPGASSTTFTVDVSNSLLTSLQVWSIAGGTVNATNGVIFQAFSTPDNMWYDTVSYYPPIIMPQVASTLNRQSFMLSTGKYLVQLVNQDPSNSVTVMATTGNIV
jgi:hypothetical protein